MVIDGVVVCIYIYIYPFRGPFFSLVKVGWMGWRQGRESLRCDAMRCDAMRCFVSGVDLVELYISSFDIGAMGSMALSTLVVLAILIS
jgi:hypothetical protein